MGIQVRGREFQDLDNPQGRAVVVIDESLAARFFPKSSPIGSYLVLDEGNGDATPREIVGVAGAVRHFSLDEEALNTIYIPLYQTSPAFVPRRTTTLQLAVRTAGQPMRTAETIRTELGRIAGDVPASSPRTMEQYWASAIASRRFNRSLLSGFALAALLLAASGLYALISCSVARRTREIGVRMALGARRGSIAGLVLREGLSVVLPGVAVGIAGAAAAGRLLKTLLYGTEPFDAAALAGAAALLIAVAVAATLAPAWKATRVDPLAALRAE
jgi:putative ABC transport system permease protein